MEVFTNLTRVHVTRAELSVMKIRISLVGRMFEVEKSRSEIQHIVDRKLFNLRGTYSGAANSNEKTLGGGVLYRVLHIIPGFDLYFEGS